LGVYLVVPNQMDGYEFVVDSVKVRHIAETYNKNKFVHQVVVGLFEV